MRTRLTQAQRSEATRNACLDAAELLFAKNGYHGTGIREIADSAALTSGGLLGAFGSKHQIMLALIERRANDIAILRKQAFDVLVERPGVPDYSDLIFAYLDPLLDYMESGDANKIAYVQILTQLATSPAEWYEHISKYYDHISKLYVDELCRASPGLNRDSVASAFVFTINCMLITSTSPVRNDVLAKDSKPTKRGIVSFNQAKYIKENRSNIRRALVAAYREFLA
ncbi:TetR/AcrR family transcriptional regulator [Mesorhizobium sp. NPDC059054]|uniref:TetR/AcrR family transcriptional regulator n=1 Tax=Mesorhizobium sp. NPDC059054 TaxID=3346711 RepID=UPI0036797850